MRGEAKAEAASESQEEPRAATNCQEFNFRQVYFRLFFLAPFGLALSKDTQSRPLQGLHTDSTCLRPRAAQRCSIDSSFKFAPWRKKGQRTSSDFKISLKMGMKYLKTT